MRTPDLPIRRHAAAILEALERDPRLVLTAETGSGKSTQMPQILAERALGAGRGVPGEILVLEPRRLAARLLARRVAEEMGGAPGELVGWQTRFDRAWSARTRIGFVTEGVFIRRWIADPSLRGVDAVLVDEFHERSILADLALGLARRTQAHQRPELRLVVMSATLDAARLASTLDAACIHAEGRMHPVSIIHRPSAQDLPPWVSAADALDELLDAGTAEGDVLVFMPGVFEIDRTVEAIGERLRRRGDRAFVAGLHGAMTAERQDEALRPRAERRVIVATNVAQTSITIEGVATVIDSGTARVHRHDPRRALDALVLEPISRAAADQRAGRAGRTRPGRCVRLWSEQDHARRPAFDAPEITRSDLAEPLLTVAAAMPGGFAEIERFPWVEVPPRELVEQARSALERLQCIDDVGAVTATGRTAASMPLHPRLARAMIEAATLGCTDRAAAWCAIAASRDFVEERSPTALLRVLEADDAPSDLTVRERLLGGLRGGGDGAERAVGARGRRELPPSAPSARVHPGAIDEARRARDQLRRLAPASGAASTRSAEAVTRAMLAGFPEFVAWRPDRERPHAFLAGRRKVEIDRESVVRAAGFVLALEVRADPRDPATQRLSMLTPVDRAWLEAVAPSRFSRIEEERWNPATRAVEAIEELRFDDIPIESTSRPARRLDAAAQILAERIGAGEIELAQWDERVEQWIARVRCVAEWFPDRGLLRYDDEDLMVIRSEIVHGATRASQLADRPCLDAVRQALASDDARFVDRMAPAELPLPSGRRLRLRYQPGQPPRGAARIQDLFDLRETPSVAGGRIAVLLEILAPSQRPLQVTSDLPGFFERLYPQLRPELRRRYPRHEWR